MAHISGAELAARTLSDLDVEHFFNVTGLGIFPLAEAVIRRDDIRYLSGLNETTVALMAEGYARASREPAVLNLYHASGTALGMMALTVAWADHSPLVLTTTTNSRGLAGREHYAAVPESITETTDPYTKWSWEVPLAQRIPEALRKAITIATAPPMGPVHLAFPMDLFAETVAEESIGSRRTPRERAEPVPSDRELDRVVQLLRGAEAPLIAVGGSVGQLRAMGELVGFAEALGAPVAEEGSTSAYLPFPREHDLYIGELTHHRDFLRDVDLLFAIDFSFTELAPGQFSIDPSQTVIQLTIDESSIGRAIQPDVAVIGHPKSTLARLTQAYTAVDGGRGGGRELDGIAELRRGNDRGVERFLDAIAAHDRPSIAEAVCKHLQPVFGEDLVIVNQANSGGPLLSLVPFADPDSYYSISQRASAQGWGVPAALGVQLALPERPVVAVVGDGSFLFTGPSCLYSAVVHDIPVTVLLLDNRGWGGGGYDGLLAEPDRAEFFGGFGDHPIDFQAVSAGFGVHVESVTAPGEAREALTAARDHPGPSVVSVPVSPDGIAEFRSFRSGIIGELDRE